MAKYKFEQDSLIIIDGVLHRPLGDQDNLVKMTDTSGTVFTIRRLDGTEAVPTLEEFERLIEDGRVVVREAARRADALTIRDTAEWDADQCSELDPKSARRLFACRILDMSGVPNGVKAMERALDGLWTAETEKQYGPRPNAATVKRWRSERGRINARSQRDMVSMQGRTTGGNDRTLVVDHCIQAGVAECRNGGPKTTIVSAHAKCTMEMDLINRGEHPLFDEPDVPYDFPSYATVRRAVNAAESLAYTAERNGKTHASARWLGGGEGLEASRPLELGIIDHSPLPCVVVDPELEMVLGPVWLTILVDVCSRAILGWVVSFNSPSLWSVGEVLRRANRPKRPPVEMQTRYPGLRTIMGRTSELIVDNAAEFVGHGMEAIAAGSGMVVRHCPVKEPRFRGIGERMFGTIKSKLCDHLPNAKMPIAWARTADYDAEEGAVTTIDDIEAAMNHIIAEIHSEKSEALDNRCPLMMFEKGTRKHGIDRWWDVETATRELLEVVPEVQLSKSGIRQFGMRYFDAKRVVDLLDDLVKLEPRRQRREDATATVKIRYDPNDISEIHVWNRQTHRYVTLKCDQPTYAKGMPLWLHKTIRRLAKEEGEAFNSEKERLLARARRIEAIRNIKPKSDRADRILYGKLLEIPRQNQVRGNIVEVDDVEPHAVTVADFISHDVASLTSLDAEILSPRKPISKPAVNAAPRPSVDAIAEPKQLNEGQEAPKKRRRSSRRIKNENGE